MSSQQWNPLCQIGRSATQFRDPATPAALWAHSGVDGHHVSGIDRNRCCVIPRKGEIEMMKFVIAAGLTVAMVAAASAADLPARSRSISRRRSARCPSASPRSGNPPSARLRSPHGTERFRWISWKGEACPIDRRDIDRPDCACLGDWRSRLCWRAISRQLPHKRPTRAVDRKASVSTGSLSASPMRPRLGTRPRRRSRRRHRQHGTPRPKALTTSTSAPGRQRAGDMPSSGMARPASGRSRSRASRPRGTRSSTSLVI